jgi:hypothetical protein
MTADHAGPRSRTGHLAAVPGTWTTSPRGPWDPTAEEARALDHSRTQDTAAGPDTEADDLGRKSVATVLVEIAQDRYRFGTSTDGDTFAVPKAGPQLVSLLRGGKKSLRAQLASEYFARTRRTAPQQALADALLAIEGTAQQDDEQPLHLRVARHDGALWLDLGDATGTAVKVTPAGWTVEASVPVLFRRTALTAALPAPVAGGSLDELWRWLNVEPDDRPLLAAWLVCALRPDTPHPALGLFGEQGTGKTSAMKLVVSTIDATPVPARKPPRDQDSWVTAAAGSWVVGLDNLSDIPAWLSDSICRAVTGDGDVRRRLYTDADLAVFAFRRCIVFNGIDLGGLRGDLADRLVPIHLRRIPDTERLDEESLWPAWTDAHPRILGAVLDLAAAVTRTLPTITLDARPRMADFARIVAAVDTVLGTAGLAHYLAKQGALATDSLTDDHFAAAIRTTLRGAFTGTSAELLHLVTPPDPDWRAPKTWPTTPRAVTTWLHRQAPVMRKAGWTVDDDNAANKANVVRWTINPPARESGNQASPGSPPSSTPVPAPADASPDSPTASQARQPAPALTSPGESREAGEAHICLSLATGERTSNDEGTARHDRHA